MPLLGNFGGRVGICKFLQSPIILKRLFVRHKNMQIVGCPRKVKCAKRGEVSQKGLKCKDLKLF